MPWNPISQFRFNPLYLVLFLNFISLFSSRENETKMSGNSIWNSPGGVIQIYNTLPLCDVAAPNFQTRFWTFISIIKTYGVLYNKGKFLRLISMIKNVNFAVDFDLGVRSSEKIERNSGPLSGHTRTKTNWLLSGIGGVILIILLLKYIDPEFSDDHIR